MLFYFCHCCFPFSESFVRLFIWTKNLEKKKKEAMEKILTQVVETYVKCNEFSKDITEEDLKSFADHIVDTYDSLPVTVGNDSTNEMKKKLKLETVSLKRTTVEEDYLNCKEALMKLRGAYSGEFKQSVWEVKVCTCRCSSVAFQLKKCTMYKRRMGGSTIIMIIIIIIIITATLIMITITFIGILYTSKGALDH